MLGKYFQIWVQDIGIDKEYPNLELALSDYESLIGASKTFNPGYYARYYQKKIAIISPYNRVVKEFNPMEGK